MREGRNFCANYLTNVLNDLDGFLYATETYWFDEPHNHFISLKILITVQGRELCLCDLV